MLRVLAMAACLAGCHALSGDESRGPAPLGGGDADPERVMFAAVLKGRGKVKVLGALGVQRIKQICAELDQGGDFKCGKVFGTGASGTLIGGNNKEWLPDEIKRIVKKLKMSEAYSLNWRVAEDTTLIQPIGKRKPGVDKRQKRSYFAVEQQTKLFSQARYRNRKLIAPEDSPSYDQSAVTPLLQHDAPIFLGALSSWAGGCTARCNDPATFRYTATGKGVTVYIVDGTVVDHEEFKDMQTGVSRISEDRHYSATAAGQMGQTCAGDHGTHVAALATGYEFGVGKDATIVSVAVQPGCEMSGMASELEEGLDWVLDRHMAQPEPRKPAVVSMSLLVQANTAAADLIAEKVEELLEAGVTVVAAAGNYHEDCFECTAIYSGTSQATPLVSGLIAAYLETNPTADPETVKTALQKVAAVNVLEVLGHPYDTTVNYFAQVSV